MAGDTKAVVVVEGFLRRVGTAFVNDQLQSVFGCLTVASAGFLLDDFHRQEIGEDRQRFIERAAFVMAGDEVALAGLAANGLATAINAGWSAFLLTWGRRQRSPALVGDGWHLMTDVATSLGVLAGLALATLTGWQGLDPALAALVGANILWAGWRLVRESVGGLMDEAVTGEVARQIRHVISASAEGAIQAHDVKTRMAGRVTFIELHLVVPGGMTVAVSHRICDRIEAALTEAVPGAEVLIHVEPEDEAKQTGVPVL